MIRSIAFLALSVFVMSRPVLAKDDHGHNKHHADTQMAKLHKMMPLYAGAQARISAALENGDLGAVAKDTSYLLSTAADLGKSTPHKNRENSGEFRKIAAAFGKDVQATADAAKKGDLGAAKAAFTRAGKHCNACHAKFRD